MSCRSMALDSLDSGLQENELIATDDRKEIRCRQKKGAFVVLPKLQPAHGDEVLFWAVPAQQQPTPSTNSGGR